jgi:hypothetical protein
LEAGVYYKLFALLLLVAALHFVAQRSLLDALKRFDRPQWEAPGCPELFKISGRQFVGANGIQDELRMIWYVLSMQYRHNDNQGIKNAGNFAFASQLGAWFIAICMLAIGKW